MVLSKWIFVYLLLPHKQNTAASLELHSASRGLAVPPPAALLCPRRITRVRAQLGERGVLKGPPGDGSRTPRDGGNRTMKDNPSVRRSNSVCINASVAVLCCIPGARRGWVGWCVSGWLGRSLGEGGLWVGRWVGEWSSVSVD